MENDLIHRGALIDKIDEKIYNVPYNNNCATIRSGMEQILSTVEDAPAVDAVEVVRCHECQNHTEDPETGKLYCRKPLGCMGCIEVKPDDFCSRGERKEKT